MTEITIYPEETAYVLKLQLDEGKLLVEMSEKFLGTTVALSKEQVRDIIDFIIKAEREL